MCLSASTRGSSVEWRKALELSLRRMRPDEVPLHERVHCVTATKQRSNKTSFTPKVPLDWQAGVPQILELSERNASLVLLCSVNSSAAKL